MDYKHYLQLTELARSYDYSVKTISDTHLLVFDHITKEYSLVHYTHDNGLFDINPYEEPVFCSSQDECIELFNNLLRTE